MRNKLLRNNLFWWVLTGFFSIKGYGQEPRTYQSYHRTDAMIPMRDGIRLYTVIWTPDGASEALPFLLQRTPYGADHSIDPATNGFVREMAFDGYIFVFQDVRGRYKSEGTFVLRRFLRDKHDPMSIDESTDTYDTFDWLLKNVPNNNGKAGIDGGSYCGWTAVMGAIDPHPALKAVCEEAAPADMFLGDDFHHNGAFRLSVSFEHAFTMEASHTDTLFPIPAHDTYGWYLQLGPLSNVNKKYFHDHLPTWNNFVAHPNYDSFWKKQALALLLDSPRVPVLNVAGWWDQEDFYGPVTVYQTWEKHDPHGYNHLVVGPWNHAGWGHWTGEKLGNIDFHSPTAAYFREKIQAKWFAWYLKGRGDGYFPKVIAFQTGSDQWMTYDSWPPKAAFSRKLYLRESGKLSFDPPSADGDTPYDSYVSDPANPVPYRTRPIEETYSTGSRWYTWLTEDQRFVQDRPDVRTWTSDPLDADLTLTGNITAKLFAATTGSDADWVVKLIDVYPDDAEPTKMKGYAFMIANDVFRGRFRKSFEHPEPITPNKVEEYTIDLHTQDHVFLKGHRIMVQVQSTWFPLIDRNPQTFVANIFEAKESDYRAATQRIYHSPEYPSQIQLMVMGTNDK